MDYKERGITSHIFYFDHLMCVLCLFFIVKSPEKLGIYTVIEFPPLLNVNVCIYDYVFVVYTLKRFIEMEIRDRLRLIFLAPFSKTHFDAVYVKAR